MIQSQIGSFIRRWLWLCLTGALLAAVSSYLVTVRLPKVYETSTKLLVSPGSGAGGAADYNVIQAGQALTRTYAELAKTRPVVEAALQAGGSDMPYAQVLAGIDVAPVPNTQLLQVTARGDSPENAAALANAVAAALIKQAQTTESSRFAASEEILSRQLDQVTTAIAQHSGEIGALRAQPASAERDAQLTRAEFTLTQLQQSYATVSRNFDDLRLAEARTSEVLAVVEPATPVSTPVQPRPLMNVLLAAVIGFLLAAGVASLAESLDDRLSTARRVAKFTGLPMLGAVGTGRQDARLTVDQIVAPTLSPSDRSRAARLGEAFRLMSANLQVASADSPLRTLLVTSAGAGEGKTSTAANLAIVVAQAGKSVVLIDADLHAPSLHEVFGVPNGAGLTSVLLHEHQTTASVLAQTRIEGLWVLPSGPLPPNPSELLGSQHMRQRMAQLRELADLVILDSSPVLAASDPAMLSGMVDGVLFVVNGQRTRGRDAAEAVAILRNAGARLLGAVVNRVPLYGAAQYQSYADAHEALLHPTVL